MDTTYIHGLCLVLFSFFMSGFCLFIFSFPLFALLTAARGIPAAVAALAPNYFIIITFFFFPPVQLGRMAWRPGLFSFIVVGRNVLTFY